MKIIKILKLLFFNIFISADAALNYNSFSKAIPDFF